MRDVLIFGIAFACTVIALRHPYIGVLAWTWIGLMNPHKEAWGFVYNFPIAQMIAVGILVGLVFTRDPRSLRASPVVVVQAMLLGWMLITSYFALYPDLIGEQLSKVLKIQLMLFVTLALIHSRKQIHWLVVVAAASLAFYGVKGGIFTILTAGSYRVWGPPGTFIGDNNHLAMALVMTVPLLFYIYKMVEHRLLRWGLLASMVLTVLAALGTHSRGGFLAAVAMMLVLWWRSGRRFVLAVPMLFVSALLFTFMPEAWWERMQSIVNYEEDGSAMGRINAWTMAFNLASDRLTGGGFYVFTQELFDRYSPAPEDGVRAAHSIYFQILGEHGFIGLGLFLLLWLLCWRQASWLMKQGAKLESTKWVVPLAAMIQVSFVGYMVGGAFLSLAYFDLPYLLAVILVACREFVRREQAAAARQPAAPAAAAIPAVQSREPAT